MKRSRLPRVVRAGRPSTAAAGDAAARASKAPGSVERLQKRLSNAGVGSRREVESWIRAGRITVNGIPAILGQKVGPSDLIKLDERPVRQRAPVTDESVVFVANRSPGEELRDELMLRLPKRSGRRYIAISPMPHQDGGLELLTADGTLAAKLQRLSGHCIAEFRVRIRGDLPEPQRHAVLAGQLDSGAQLEVLTLEDNGGEGEAANRWLTLRARGASGREVRELMERHGALVSRVMRVRLGSLLLAKDLPRGRFRRLEAAELNELLGAGSSLRIERAAADTPGRRTQ